MASSGEVQFDWGEGEVWGLGCVGGRRELLAYRLRLVWSSTVAMATYASINSVNSPNKAIGSDGLANRGNLPRDRDKLKQVDVG